MSITAGKLVSPSGTVMRGGLMLSLWGTGSTEQERILWGLDDSRRLLLKIGRRDFRFPEPDCYCV